MNMTTIWVSKDLKDELAMLKITEKKDTFAELIKEMLEKYKKSKEEK